MGPPRKIHLPSIYTNKEYLQQSANIRRPLTDTVGTFLTTQGMVPKPFVPAGGRAPSSSSDLEPTVSTSCQEVPLRPEHQPSCLEVIQFLIRKAGFSERLKQQWGFGKLGHQMLQVRPTTQIKIDTSNSFLYRAFYGSMNTFRGFNEIF